MNKSVDVIESRGNVFADLGQDVEIIVRATTKPHGKMSVTLG